MLQMSFICRETRLPDNVNDTADTVIRERLFDLEILCFRELSLYHTGDMVRFQMQFKFQYIFFQLSLCFLYRDAQLLRPGVIIQLNARFGRRRIFVFRALPAADDRRVRSAVFCRVCHKFKSKQIILINHSLLPHNFSVRSRCGAHVLSSLGSPACAGRRLITQQYCVCCAETNSICPRLRVSPGDSLTARRSSCTVFRPAAADRGS